MEPEKPGKNPMARCNHRKITQHCHFSTGVHRALAPCAQGDHGLLTPWPPWGDAGQQQGLAGGVEAQPGEPIKKQQEDGVHAQTEQAASGGESGRSLSPPPSGDHGLSLRRQQQADVEVPQADRWGSPTGKGAPDQGELSPDPGTGGPNPPAAAPSPAAPPEREGSNWAQLLPIQPGDHWIRPRGCRIWRALAGNGRRRPAARRADG